MHYEFTGRPSSMAEKRSFTIWDDTPCLSGVLRGKLFGIDKSPKVAHDEGASKIPAEPNPICLMNDLRACIHIFKFQENKRDFNN